MEKFQKATTLVPVGKSWWIRRTAENFQKSPLHSSLLLSPPKLVEGCLWKSIKEEVYICPIDQVSAGATSQEPCVLLRQWI